MNDQIKTIALFDFDGTITTNDTLIELARFKSGIWGLIKGLTILSPYLIGLKLGIADRKKTKERFLSYFFAGMMLDDFHTLCQRFSAIVIPKIIRQGAIKQIRWHLEQAHTVVIVTASASNWVSIWCKEIGIHCIATELEINEYKITGKISGNNCHGEEKVVRIKQLFDLKDYHQVFTYGDSKGDIPMLSLGTEQHYKPFR